MSGIVNSTGAVSGVIGTTVGTPESDADVQKDAWRIGRSAANHYTSDQTLGWNIEHFLGSNITHSSGQITVTTAGLYLCHARIANKDTEANDHDWRFRVNGSNVNGTRMYQIYVAAGNQYGAVGNTVVLIIGAGQTVEIFGNGYTYGEAAAGSFTSFTGVRIGALT